MSFAVQLKKNAVKFLPKKITDFFRNKMSLANIPNQKRSVISDLFPFRIQNGWETHFELLNIPMLIDPLHQQNTAYKVKFMFFDESGNCFYEWEKEMKGCYRQTICLNNILDNKSISGYGTFSCFHVNYLTNLEEQGGFLAERGYTGYANNRYSKVRGYVHGNLDALALDETGGILCLGKSFMFRKNEYRLQHLLDGPANYELGFVNTSCSEEALSVEFWSVDNQLVKLEKKIIPSKGIAWIAHEIKANKPLRVIIHSKLNLPRPVVFRIENNSFDVFHG